MFHIRNIKYTKWLDKFICNYIDTKKLKREMDNEKMRSNFPLVFNIKATPSLKYINKNMILFSMIL